ncbi:hypothetical protein CNR22_04810 [Sphingobacteriaceae bacterium]|nr:hypothetical protein CNR22_04810 [Sphingobacteriaceae bacterium]
MKMKKLNFLLSAASLIVLTGCNSPKTDGAHVEEPSHTKDSVTTAKPDEVPMDSAAMAKAWNENRMPGEMHKWMATANGKWTAEMSFRMSPDEPLSPPSKADVETRMIMEGRYQETTYKGKMMGMDFEGKEIMAYDNAKKKFISTFIDNTTTGLMYMEGTYDEASNTINFTGDITDPATGKKMDYRQELKFIDDKNQLLSAYDKKDGKEFKSMEIKLTRK